MNAIEFITQMAKDNVLGNYDARGAYNQFVQNVGQASAGTYPYFRTKFNNKCKELGIGSAPKTQDATVTYTAPAQPSRS